MSQAYSLRAVQLLNILSNFSTVDLSVTDTYTYRFQPSRQVLLLTDLVESIAAFEVSDVLVVSETHDTHTDTTLERLHPVNVRSCHSPSSPSLPPPSASFSLHSCSGCSTVTWENNDSSCLVAC